ncbi:hypothetical protein M2360_001768, partial [Rhizobium sp. SG_E_25_P2]|uniref:hypothetical protein n=1 Tax=Rhizobium sp. SG_E_25_P2 TaxID=2879942 RepID=UPI0024744CD0
RPRLSFFLTNNVKDPTAKTVTGQPKLTTRSKLTPHIRESQSLFYPKPNTKTEGPVRIQRRARLPLEATAAPVDVPAYTNRPPHRQ